MVFEGTQPVQKVGTDRNTPVRVETGAHGTDLVTQLYQEMPQILGRVAKSAVDSLFPSATSLLRGMDTDGKDGKAPKKLEAGKPLSPEDKQSITDAKKIIDAFGSDSFAVREKGSASLKEFLKKTSETASAAGLPTILDGLSSKNLEVAKRVRNGIKGSAEDLAKNPEALAKILNMPDNEGNNPIKEIKQSAMDGYKNVLKDLQTKEKDPSNYVQRLALAFENSGDAVKDTLRKTLFKTIGNSSSDWDKELFGKETNKFRDANEKFTKGLIKLNDNFPTTEKEQGKVIDKVLKDGSKLVADADATAKSGLGAAAHLLHPEKERREDKLGWLTGARGRELALLPADQRLDFAGSLAHVGKLLKNAGGSQEAVDRLQKLGMDMAKEAIAISGDRRHHISFTRTLDSLEKLNPKKFSSYVPAPLRERKSAEDD